MAREEWQSGRWQRADPIGADSRRNTNGRRRAESANLNERRRVSVLAALRESGSGVESSRRPQSHPVRSRIAQSECCRRIAAPWRLLASPSPSACAHHRHPQRRAWTMRRARPASWSHRPLLFKSGRRMQTCISLRLHSHRSDRHRRMQRGRPLSRSLPHAPRRFRSRCCSRAVRSARRRTAVCPLCRRLES